MAVVKFKKATYPIIVRNADGEIYAQEIEGWQFECNGRFYGLHHCGVGWALSDIETGLLCTPCETFTRREDAYNWLCEEHLRYPGAPIYDIVTRKARSEDTKPYRCMCEEWRNAHGVTLLVAR